MGLIVRCDAPGCAKEIRAIVTAAGRLEFPAQDTGWWYARSGDDAICACSEQHLALATALPPAS